MESSIKETLVKAVIDNNKTDVFVECPHCKHTEQHPTDEQRHHLQTFNIVMWKPDEEDKNEVSIMECIPCKEFFELEWKYNALYEWVN